MLTKQDVREVIDVYIKAWEDARRGSHPDHLHPGGHVSRTGNGSPDPRPGRDPRLLAVQGRRGAGQYHVPSAEPVPGRRHRDRRMGGGVRRRDTGSPQADEGDRGAHLRGVPGRGLREYWASEVVATVAMTDRP